jgi:glucosamine--fructose-6-phosphate aminotransferase (isomerizing)
VSRDRGRPARGVLSEDDERKLVHALIEVPGLMAEALALEPQIEQLARELAKSRDVLYLGRGTSIRWRSKAR